MGAVAIIILLSGLLILLISLPLIYRRVPMNGIYGVRIPAAFESEKRWYDINAYGGRVLASWSCLIIAAGAVGFWVPIKYAEAYGLGATALTLVCAIMPLLQVLRWSKRR